jgi:cell shape-determining protein MreD
VKLLLGLLLLYALFLLQVLLAPFGPNLVVLGVLALALHESRARATLFGLAGGLLLDTASPGSFGAACLVLSGAGWLTALLHSVAARGRWYIIVLSLLVVGLGLLAGWLAGAGLPSPFPAVVSAALTVALAVPVELLVGRILYHR